MELLSDLGVIETEKIQINPADGRSIGYKIRLLDRKVLYKKKEGEIDEIFDYSSEETENKISVFFNT